MRVPGRLRILVVFLVVCVVALLLTMSLPAGAAPVGQRTVVPAVIFSGHVYIDGTTSPLVGVTIQLYKRSGEFFLYDGETTTASDGSFSFTTGRHGSHVPDPGGEPAPLSLHRRGGAGRRGYQ